MQHFSTFCIFKLHLFWMQHFSSFSICQNSVDLFVCNTFLQYKHIKLFSTCLYATLFQLLYFYNFSHSVYMQDSSVFCIYKTSLHLITYNTFIPSVFIKFSEYVSMHHFSIFCIVQLYLFICNTFLYSVSSSFICLNATLFLFHYLFKILWICLCATLFSNLHL